MSTYGIPVDGLYRIYIPSDKPLYMELNESDSLVYVCSRNEQSNNQKWNIRRVSGKADTYRITSFDDQRTVSWKPGSYRGSVFVQAGATTEWIVEYKSPQAPRLTTSDKMSEGHYVDSCDSKTAHFYSNNPTGVAQHWAFEQIQGHTSPSIPLGPSSGDSLNTFKAKFFTLTVAEVAKQTFDIIIVGSGIGGGVLANDLYDTNRKLGKPKKILLLEKGGLVFHSHCLNTARPSGLADDRGQQNDSFFHKLKQDFKFHSDVDTNDWKGGAMYNLGGRSAAWGLFAPRVHDEVLKQRLPAAIFKDMNQYYRKAERLMLLSTPETKRSHQHIMDRLNIHGSNDKAGLLDSNVQWQWGRISSEFRDERNFDFAEGAYSTIDKILEIAMSKPEGGEHPDFKVVLNADVRSLTFADPNPKNKRAVNGVVVKDSNGDHHCIKVETGGNVILSAGSVDSPSILLRSPQVGHDKLRQNRGLRLTDHDIMFYTRSFRHTDPKLREEYGAMKLQSYANIPDRSASGSHSRYLLNMSVDASSFLPRGAAPDDSLSQFIFVVMTQSNLADESNITLDPATGKTEVELASGGSKVEIIGGEPKVMIVRGDQASESQEQAMQKLVAASMDALIEAAKIEFDGFDCTKPIPHTEIKLKTLQLGGVAHELGTLPIDNSAIQRKEKGCLNDDLQFLSDEYEGLYVCDLSIFPWSPAANPTLTLAALAIRLSRHLLGRATCVDEDGKVCAAAGTDGEICVVNHSGEKVKVWLTHRLPGDVKGGETDVPYVINPGRSKTWKNMPPIVQGLFVYKVDLVKQQRGKDLENEKKDQEADNKALQSATNRDTKRAIERRMKKREERIKMAESLVGRTGLGSDEFITTPVLVNVKPGINSIQHDARSGVIVIHRA